jgi:NADH-quinone oxidoreductase subunit A|uniref:NADH-ubiquinone oxidoreductase chain 3 n=1 Tax=Sundstroemia setigera TaxID=3005 RepID=A0A8A6KRK3_9STRA|nr:NADH dehydrogenase subunit 3 [Rhizosolenia setigera]QTI82391.1 NADH dehydrogenase subunit 3 [Rhizosolenia setigera]WAQ69954.1 NADH dehydrogenase subunit 3 [Rhizosolenia setigera]WAQ70026.1 NADH dehydrogenase subunit 3 [Rhizosolenia setigera]WAQ70062.1 NADH dehydrogenase subunit 3 [Rhizosolenia setigera]WAQ70098.1 NADH dehydrogenase subunit 3 [Rhizosolenia setigera]
MKNSFINLHIFDSLYKTEYLFILVFIVFAIFLSGIIIFLSYFLSVQNPETEKLSTYECGFEPYEDSRHKFNINFYIIAILFIVFDIEAMFLFPWTIMLSTLDITGFWSMIDFIVELGIGFLYLLYVKGLDWQ